MTTINQMYPISNRGDMKNSVIHQTSVHTYSLFPVCVLYRLVEDRTSRRRWAYAVQCCGGSEGRRLTGKKEMRPRRAQGLAHSDMCTKQDVSRRAEIPNDASIQEE
jgi:hypothetical protein